MTEGNREALDMCSVLKASCENLTGSPSNRYDKASKLLDRELGLFKGGAESGGRFCKSANERNKIPKGAYDNATNQAIKEIT